MYPGNSGTAPKPDLDNPPRKCNATAYGLVGLCMCVFPQDLLDLWNIVSRYGGGVLSQSVNFNSPGKIANCVPWTYHTYNLGKKEPGNSGRKDEKSATKKRSRSIRKIRKSYSNRTSLTLQMFIEKKWCKNTNKWHSSDTKVGKILSYYYVLVVRQTSEIFCPTPKKRATYNSYY